LTWRDERGRLGNGVRHAFEDLDRVDSKVHIFVVGAFQKMIVAFTGTFPLGVCVQVGVAAFSSTHHQINKKSRRISTLVLPSCGMLTSELRLKGKIKFDKHIAMVMTRFWGPNFWGISQLVPLFQVAVGVGHVSGHGASFWISWGMSSRRLPRPDNAHQSECMRRDVPTWRPHSPPPNRNFGVGIHCGKYLFDKCSTWLAKRFSLDCGKDFTHCTAIIIESRTIEISSGILNCTSGLFKNHVSYRGSIRSINTC
jgi:hypothetical protein